MAPATAKPKRRSAKPRKTAARGSLPKAAGTPAPKAAEPRPVKRKERLDRTRRAILESALSHFGRVGFDGASLREIAADASVNHAMIRHIYGTKNELWRETITFLFERTSEELNQNADELRGLSDLERMKAFIRRYVEYCARHPEHARIMIQQSILEGSELSWAAEQFIRARHKRDMETYERLKTAGKIPNVDTVTLRFVIVGACQMIYLLAPEVRTVDGKDVFTPDAIREHADAVIKLLFR